MDAEVGTEFDVCGQCGCARKSIAGKNLPMQNQCPKSFPKSVPKINKSCELELPLASDEMV